MSKENAVKEPLFHISKRASMPIWKKAIVYAAALLCGFIVCGIIFAVVFKLNPFSVYAGMFKGAFGTKRKFWRFVRDAMLLLGVGLALIPAFKMKFWNLGGNGQILVGALASVACMFYLGGKMPDWSVNILMFITSVIAGAIWAAIPATFKALFKTNESLFTLMMNYVAVALVQFAISKWNPNGSMSLAEIRVANLPTIGANYMYLFISISILIIEIIMTIYLRFSKHGYELAVVGESENTARYIGINVKKVTIRTLCLSGAICGIVGFLLAGSWHHSITPETANNMGFTSILVAWLAGFNPIMMILSAAFVTFLNNGMSGVLTTFNITSSAIPQVVIGIMYFCVLGFTFFISYKVKLTKKIEIPFLKKKTKANDKEGK